MISMDKNYKYANGEPARILCVDVPISHTPVISMNTSGSLYRHKINGKSEWDATHNLIEVSPYDDFKIDEPVMVRGHDSSSWKRRYFAGISPDGNPMAFIDGATLWSSAGETHTWSQCRRPTPEEKMA